MLLRENLVDVYKENNLHFQNEVIHMKSLFYVF